MARRRKGRPVNGWLILDKPADMTSTQVVNIVRHIFDARKAGHAGTLDPLATGILPIALGEATKTINIAVDGTKGYRFTVQWGAQTTTDDSEGEIVATRETRPTLGDVEAALDAFVGNIEQVPPKFSAIKVDGQRAYDLARDGAAVELAARQVTVHSLRVVDMPDADQTVLEAECGKGTYVRSIARDLGEALGCLGHVTQLRRTVVGPFDEASAVTLEALRQRERDETQLEVLQPVSAALGDLAELRMTNDEIGRIRRGQPVILRGRDAPVRIDAAYATLKGELVALGAVAEGAFVPKRVFNLGSGGSEAG
ncbi:MAG: tRNA pseudouridine(55) synthase TruB [Pseudomonadota bacterium]